jgi:adenylate cyclase
LTYRFDISVLDPAREELRVSGKPVELRPKAYKLLRFLLDNPNRLLPKDELIKAVWPDTSVGDESLTQCISEVRAAIADEDQTLVKTVPRRGYILTAAVTRDAAPPGGVGFAPPSDGPSIAVLPFVNLGSDPTKDYLCDGLTEDVITELCRFHELFVVARNSTFQYKGRAVDVRTVGRDLGVRYVLEGSVRANREFVRVTAQLIDAATGSHRWAERYDHAFTDSFAVQNEIARTIASILASTVNRAEIERSAVKPATDWRAYDYCLRAAANFSSYQAVHRMEELYETRRLLHESIAIDPTYSRAYSWLALSHISAYYNAVDADFLNPAAVDTAYHYATKAVQLDPASPRAHADLGYILNWKVDQDAAVVGFERAFMLNPNFSDTRFPLILNYACQFERAIEAAKSAMRNDPYFPPQLLSYAGLAHYMTGQYAEAYVRLRECVARTTNRSAHTWLAATCARMGRLDEAAQVTADVLRILPSYTIDGVSRRVDRFKHAEAGQHFLDGLRMAGLPER